MVKTAKHLLSCMRIWRFKKYQSLLVLDDMIEPKWVTCMTKRIITKMNI
jgi:hypothetical protein